MRGTFTPSGNKGLDFDFDFTLIQELPYTPRSLAQVMVEAGLVNVRQKPAQFKLRGPRDMRVVGEKPPG